jgi:hypothetical protein
MATESSSQESSCPDHRHIEILVALRRLRQALSALASNGVFWKRGVRSINDTITQGVAFIKKKQA